MIKRILYFFAACFTVTVISAYAQVDFISEASTEKMSADKKRDTLLRWAETNFYFHTDTAIAYLNRIPRSNAGNNEIYRIALAKAEAFLRKKDSVNTANTLDTAKIKKKYCDDSELLLKYYYLRYSHTLLIEKDTLRAYLYVDSGIALTTDKYILPGEYGVKIFLSKADYFDIKNRKKEALEMLLSALVRTEGIANKNLKALVLVRLGNIFKSQNAYSTAIDYYSQLCDITKEQKDSNFLATALQFKSLCLKEIGSLDEALSITYEAYVIRNAINDIRGIPPLIADAGFILNKMGRPDSTVKLMEYYFRLSDSLKLPPVRSYVASMIYSEALILNKEWKKATHLLDSLERDVPANYTDEGSKAWTYNLLGVAYFESGNEETAYRYFKKNEELNFDKLLYRLRFDHHYYMSLIEFKKGNYNAFKRQMRSLTELAKDLSREQNKENFSEVQGITLINQRLQESSLYKKELEKMQYENDLEKANKRNFTYMTVIFGLTAVFFLAAYFYTRKTLKIQRAQNLQIRNQQDEITGQNVELEAQNERLQELDLEKNNVLRIASHDLKAPLSRVFGLINLIEMDSKLLNDDQKTYITQIKYILNTNNSMITKLLDLNAIEESGIKIIKKETDVLDMISNLFKQYQYAFEKRNIRPLLQSNVTPVTVMSDQQILTGIIDNLLSNAIKFSPDDTEIKISVINKDNCLRVEISDRGPGIKDSEKNKVFRKFEKLSSRPKQGESSSGLGLYIAKSYVQKMNGIIDFKNRKDGGTTFYFEIPLD